MHLDCREGLLAKSEFVELKWTMGTGLVVHFLTH